MRENQKEQHFATFGIELCHKCDLADSTDGAATGCLQQEACFSGASKYLPAFSFVRLPTSFLLCPFHYQDQCSFFVVVRVCRSIAELQS